MSTPLFSKQCSIVFDASTIGCAQDFSLAVNKDMIEIACLGSTGSKTNVPDMYGWTLSFSGMVIQTATKTAGSYGFEDLMDNLISSTDASLLAYILPDVSSNAYYEGYGYLSSMTLDGGVGSAVTYSGELAGSSPLVKKTTA
jgi:Asp/Glu/hydantoin racemase